MWSRLERVSGDFAVMEVRTVYDGADDDFRSHSRCEVDALHMSLSHMSVLGVRPSEAQTLLGLLA